MSCVSDKLDHDRLSSTPKRRLLHGSAGGRRGHGPQQPARHARPGGRYIRGRREHPLTRGDVRSLHGLAVTTPERSIDVDLEWPADAEELIDAAIRPRRWLLTDRY